MNKHPKLLQKENTVLLVIDIQEKLVPVIHEGERVIQNTIKLVNGFKILNSPIYYTEQYPKGLGETEKRIKEALGESKVYTKMSFSCSGAMGLFDELKQKNIKQVAVCGVESHVCVLQTVLDLIANDFSVYIASDAVSSRREFDYRAALNRMERHGAEITLTESILFEMLEVCGTDQFRAVSKLVK
ncbi:MAG: isochorismatase family protein [Bacteroidota bacterium]